MRLEIFAIKKCQKQGSDYTFLAVVSIDFVLKKDENYYPQVFLKECKYIEKIIICITDDL